MNIKIIRKYETRREYLNNPLSAEEFLHIQNLCNREKLTVYLIISCYLLALLANSFDGKLGFLLISIMNLVIILYGLLPVMRDFVVLTIEEATFKSSDPLIGYNSERHNRLLPSNISADRNIYANDTLQHHFFEKLKSLNRPIMRFEVDILNSLKN